MTKLQQLTERIQELVADTKVIVSTLTLEDVLRALPELGYSEERGFVQFHKEPRQHFTRYAQIWEHGKPLYEQSEETITFLWELLCNNNSK